MALKLLLVDDDLVDRMAVKRALADARVDADLDERSDLTSALDALGRTEYDCVIVDYHLPGSTALEMLAALRAGHVRVPVVCLTGQGDEELAVTIMKAGAADYLNKASLSPDRLERSIRYAMAMHRADVERRQLLAREQQAREQAQAANRAKDEFLATLSHELRTPLNAILGWSRLLAGGHLDDATSRRAVEIIERNTRIQAQLIEDLLDISRIISGKLRLEFRTVPVHGIVDGALESVRHAAEARRITLEVTIDGRPHEADRPDAERMDLSLLCDPARMQQVIWNLLNNAIKFTPEGGRVTLAVGREQDQLTITVSDTGVGIAPSFLPYVFERFRQQDGANTRQFGGLGLGLSLVRHLAELHGGTVSAFSEGENRGATFTVSVPIAPIRTVTPEMPVAGETPPLEELPRLDGISVLVVENEADARLLIAAVLENCGARVTTADSAAAALAELERRVPDVLLSDLAMPVEDGFALIRTIRSSIDPTRRDLPAGALTAFATTSDRTRALLAGFHVHIPKPVEPAELAAVVASLAARPHAVRS